MSLNTPTPKNFKLELTDQHNHTVNFEIKFNNWAALANSSFVFCSDTNQVFTTTVISTTASSSNFLPLQIIFNEKLYAVGEIPSGYGKREGKPSTYVTILARAADRSVRPFLDENIRNDIQTILMPLNINRADRLEALCINATTISLHHAGAENELVGAVHLYADKTYQWSLVKTEQTIHELLFAGTKDKICMIEADCQELPTEHFMHAVKTAQEFLGQITNWMQEILTAIPVKKVSLSKFTPLISLQKTVQTELKHFDLENHLHQPKLTRRANWKKWQDELIIKCQAITEYQSLKPEELAGQIEHYASLELKLQYSEYVVKHQKRINDRELNALRSLSEDMHLFDKPHGTGLFTRGLTTVLATTTLGTIREKLLTQDLSMFDNHIFFHQYNFLPFCAGETGRYGIQNRREIGHGNLAERALKTILPPQSDFPFAIRTVSEVLSSDGSTSQAAICAGYLSLVDANVPVTNPIAGIAMGLLSHQNNHIILTDIEDYEDFFGLMDFKIAATPNGIAAMQLDVKNDGLTLDLIAKTITDAWPAIQKINDFHQKTIAEKKPQTQHSLLKCIKVEVPAEKTGEIIGPGHNNVKAYIAKYPNLKIEIEDSIFFIYGTNDDEINAVSDDIKNKIWLPEVGTVYDAKVTLLNNIGIEFQLTQTQYFGWIAYRNVPQHKISALKDVKINDSIQVKAIKVDKKGTIFWLV